MNLKDKLEKAVNDNEKIVKTKAQLKREKEQKAAYEQSRARNKGLRE